MIPSRWLPGMALITVTVFYAPVGMAIGEPATQSQQQQVLEQATKQEEPGASKEPEVKEERKKATREEKRKQREQKKAEKKARKKEKKGAAEDQRKTGELKARIARVTDPAVNDKVRQKGIFRLGRSNDPEATATLLKLARDKKEKLNIRAWAIESLAGKKAKMDKKELAQPMLEILQDTTEPQHVRGEAAAALGTVRDPAGIKALQAASKDKAPEVRVRAVLALNGLGIDQVRLLGQLLNDEEVTGESRALAAKLLGWTGDPKAADPLMKALAQRPKPGGPPPNPASATGPVGPDAEGRAKPAQSEVTEDAKNPKADLLEALTTSEQTRENFRLFSVLALGRLKAKQATPLLRELLKGDPDPAVRTESAHTLLALTGPEAEEAFIAALKDQDAAVRLAAAVALKQVGSPKAVTPLIEALKDPHRRVRFQAAEALGRLGHPSADAAIEPLKTLVEKEQVAYVKEAAQAALEKLLPPAPAKANGEKR